MYKCKTCSREFDTARGHNAHVSHHTLSIEKRMLGKTCQFCNIKINTFNHSRFCKKNPNYERNIKLNKELMSKVSDNTGAGAKSRVLLEKAATEALKEEGYEVFFPWVVCDRIAIKNGKVYFVEFKDEGQVLKLEQQMVNDLVPDMYLLRRYKRV
jgi:DNA-directed RNA polymerase subunit RPC12/RpoP